MYYSLIKSKLASLTFLLALSLSFNAFGNHHIFLTTQAETKHTQVNPALSQCGRLRANQLSTLLSHSNIKYVYSTTDLSTMETANPIARMNGLPVKIFTPSLIDSLAVTITELTSNVLVVANDEIIKFLIEFISKNKLEINNTHNKNLLYQLTIVDKEVIINVFKHPLQC